MIGRTIRNVLPDSITSMIDENGGNTNWHDVGTLKLDAAVLPTVTSYENVDSHTVYHTVWAPSPGEYFTASHRFSAFVELHKAIQVACGLPAAFPVPATLAVTESVRQQRVFALQHYLMVAVDGGGGGDKCPRQLRLFLGQPDLTAAGSGAAAVSALLTPRAPPPALPDGPSVADTLRAQLPAINTAESFAEARKLLRENNGADRLKLELEAAGVVSAEGELTTALRPFNPFARLVSGAMRPPPPVEAANALLSEAHAARFMVAFNLPDADKHWDSRDEAWLGKASLSRRHRFLLVRELKWGWFNALVFGLGGKDELQEAVEMLEAARAAAKDFARADVGWSRNLGLYFHCYPHNSVPAFHLHLVDLEAVGPSFEASAHKHLPLNAVLDVLKAELRWA